MLNNIYVCLLNFNFLNYNDFCESEHLIQNIL